MEDTKINYKNAWFEVCEKKKQLQIENFRLKKNYDWLSKRFENLERLYSKFIMKNWNKNER